MSWLKSLARLAPAKTANYNPREQRYAQVERLSPTEASARARSGLMSIARTRRASYKMAIGDAIEADASTSCYAVCRRALSESVPGAHL
jgi:hypothetical protein